MKIMVAGPDLDLRDSCCSVMVLLPSWGDCVDATVRMVGGGFGWHASRNCVGLSVRSCVIRGGAVLLIIEFLVEGESHRIAS